MLVVEDNFFLAEHITAILEARGCTVVGPVGRLRDGLRLAAQEALDGAVLDINLHGDQSFPIADMLHERGIPFVFLTGYDDGEIVPIRLRESVRLGKPVLDSDLIEMAERTFVH